VLYGCGCEYSGAGVSTVSDMMYLRRYIKIKKYMIWTQLYIIIKYIFINI
jgi:hypothetical protein